MPNNGAPVGDAQLRLGAAEVAADATGRVVEHPGRAGYPTTLWTFALEGTEVDRRRRV
jgi:hypothetical protein